MKAEMINDLKRARLKAQSVRLEPNSIENLKNMKIEIWGIQLKTYQDKIDHLMWYYLNNIDKK